jgi:hypothetical protein
MLLNLLQDIRATHLATEAPFQVLLKLSMILLGILPVPGMIFHTWLISSRTTRVIFQIIF